MTLLHLVTGKGGTGKSTVAASCAVAAARAGEAVLVVSLDQAHSLRDVFECADGSPECPPGSVGICELDTVALAADRWRALTSAASAAGLVSRLGGDVPSADEITAAPGIQEVLGLAAVADRVGEGGWDRVVVDCPPTADTLRMLELPSALSSTLERVWPRHRRLGVPPSSGSALVAVGMAEQIEAVSARLTTLLEDPARTAVTVVATTGSVVLAETRRTLTALGLLGIRIGGVVVNRSGSHGRAPADAPGQDGLGLGEVPVVRLPSLPFEPVGIAGVEPLADVLAGDPSRAGAGPPFVGSRAADGRGGAVLRESGSGLDAVYAMDLRLPLADPAGITLGRVGDDLIVGAAGVRHRVRLAPVLRRCDVLDATVEAGTLRVRFTPDSEVWPR